MGKSRWPNSEVLDLLGIQLPILQAPMAGAQDSALVIAVSEAGGLGSFPCAVLTPDRIREEVLAIRRGTTKPFGLNFFCHDAPAPDLKQEAMWLEELRPYYQELGIEVPTSAVASRRAFDDELCSVVEELEPRVVSFHFGLPEEGLLKRVRATGAKVLSSATTVAEARWLEERGCDCIIAQGAEAGGHRGMFLTQNVASQVGTFALVPQVVDAVNVPVIAAGGIADERGIVAALALGASAVQIGTAYLLCPEARISPVHRRGLEEVTDQGTAITNVLTGRPARAIVNRFVREKGPLNSAAPAFPLASGAVAPLRAASEATGSADFVQMWSGQSARLARAIPAADLTRELGSKAASLLAALADRGTIDAAAREY